MAEGRRTGSGCGQCSLLYRRVPATGLRRPQIPVWRRDHATMEVAWVPSHHHRLGNDFENIVISQQHGKLPDLMETITELKPQYSQAWLEEYTPYRLAAALGRWDAEYEYWRRLQANFFQMIEDYNPEKGLPPFGISCRKNSCCPLTTNRAAVISAYELSSRPERSDVEGPAVRLIQHQIQMEAPPSPLSSRAQPRDLQFCRLVLEMFFEEAVWVLRPVGPTAKRQPSPGGLGHRFPTLSERRRRGTLSPQPASVPCRKTFPGRACRTADPSAALGMTKGRVALSLSVHWLMREPQVPPRRFAPVGMTIHIWVRNASVQEKLSSEKSHKLRAQRRALQLSAPFLEMFFNSA